ncbi:MAG: M23 family metallopeptidase [Anaerolineae bacterium]
MRRFGWLLWAGWILVTVLLLQPDASQAAGPQAAGVPPSDALAPRSEWLGCWYERGGLVPGHVQPALELVGASGLVVDLSYRGSEQRSGAILSSLRRGYVPAEILTESETPVWRGQTLESRLEAGLPLSLTHGVNACLPYPIKSLSLSAQPLVRGRTGVLRIETDRLVFCRARYLGQIERCYRDGDTILYVLLGVSALVEPGLYPVELELSSGETTHAFTVPLEVASGNYGRQVITPPPHLQSLIAPEVVEAEEEYLAHWRALRSPERLWTLPLASPLDPPRAVTAGFGDRRSYGGLLSGYHSGVDFRAATGVPVLAPADGTVAMAEVLTWRGNAVLLDHGGGLVTGYWHLSQIDVQVGDRVSQGERFALVGNTGLSTGSHLHFEVWADGVSVDGRQWLSGEGLELLASPVMGQEN